MKLSHLHEVAMKVTCTKCKKITDSPQAASQVPVQGVRDTIAPNICDQCSGKDASSTLPPALGSLADGAVGPNASAQKLQTPQNTANPNLQAPASMANKFRRPPPLATNTQPI